MGIPRSRLFGFRYEVEPSPSHPLYFEKEAGSLVLWILATDEEDAFTNAFMILELLPYTLVSEDITPLSADDPEGEPADLEEARKSGLKVIWAPVSFGVDRSLDRGTSAG
jgi:hypothetical protein